MFFLGDNDGDLCMVDQSEVFEIKKDNDWDGYDSDVDCDDNDPSIYQGCEADITDPTTPSGLTVNAVSPSQINLSWNASTDNVGVTGYKVYIYSGSDSDVLTYGNITELSFYMLNASTQYCYSVSAYDAAGNESPKSGQACATTSSTQTEPLIITFSPNPVTPYWETSSSTWRWDFSFNVYNPNGFPVEVVAFGQFNECLTNVNNCSYPASTFKNWFNDCGLGRTYVPALSNSCDNDYYIWRGWTPSTDQVGKYAVWYLDGQGEWKVAISEDLTLLAP